jgi:hypothetical protein
MHKRVSALVLGTAFSVLAGGAVAEVPTTIQYIGEATVFVPGTAVSARPVADQGTPAISFRGDATVFRDAPSSGAPGLGRVAPLGHQVSGNSMRVIDLNNQRTAVSVMAGETVQFNLNGRSVTWVFDTVGTPTFRLAQIVPQAPDLMVYVSANPLYKGM